MNRVAGAYYTAVAKYWDWLDTRAAAAQERSARQVWRATREQRDRNIRERALTLQAIGPDEFPYGYYEYLARHDYAAEYGLVDPAEWDE